jgi:hypothetical protein
MERQKIITYLKVIFQNLPRTRDENHEIKSEWPGLLTKCHDILWVNNTQDISYDIWKVSNNYIASRIIQLLSVTSSTLPAAQISHIGQASNGRKTTE